MHKLDRGDAPKCLNKFKHGRDNWEALSYMDRAEIWVALDAMQGQRCAYCEADISKRKHIDHFRQKASHRYPQGTFEWSNLFGSCCSDKTCASNKDGLASYNPGDLIKPDEEDPETYFLFGYDGTISPRRNLSDRQQHRALETLRILNLDHQHGPLRHMRKQAILRYSKTLEEICQLAGNLPEEEWLPFWCEALERIKSLPFSTAIKHALSSQVGVESSDIEQ